MISKSGLFISLALTLATTGTAWSADRTGATKNAQSDEEPQIDCSNGGTNTLEMNECMARDLDIAEAKLQQYLAMARDRFVGDVNDEYNDDDADTKKAAISEFDDAQKSWDAFRDQHCGSVYYQWKDGTIRGAMHLGCMIQLTQIRTRLIWQEWLIYQDSSPPMMPEPPTGFENREK
jgi:uncharacterized protein YecT (DUF1311 family)